MAVMQGKVIRFDQLKGYGFISPDEGGEDIFLHVNDLLGEKNLVKPGAVVEFLVEQGERGLKASSVRLVHPLPGMPGPMTLGSLPREVSRHRPAFADDLGSDEEFVDVLSRRNFSLELTELLLAMEPALTGPQIRVIRDLFSTMGKKYGWIGD